MSASAVFLKSVHYFSGLGTKDMERICKETAELSFSQGEILFLEGEPCQGPYVVNSGRVRIFKISPEGREQVLLIAKRGEDFSRRNSLQGRGHRGEWMILDLSKPENFEQS